MFRINGIEWNLKFVPSDSEVLRNNNVYALGVTIPSIHTIYLSDELQGDLLHHVLVHEMFHAELASRGIEVPEYVEEVLCDIVADNSLETATIANSIHDNLCRYYGRC